MNSKSVLAGIAILFMTPFGQQSSQRDRDPNAMITFRGGLGSHLLPLCQVAVKIGSGDSGTLTIKATPEDIRDAVNGSYCNGYVSGVVDTLVNLKTATASGSTSGLTRSCISSNAESDQLNRVVAKYLNDNPATLNAPAGMLIVAAMNDAFPCK